MGLIKLIVLVLSMIIICNFINAEVLYSNASSYINSEYYEGDKFSGVLNISLNNEPQNSELVIKFSNLIAGKINLNEFIKNQNILYSCNTLNCKDDYETVGTGTNSKTFEIYDSKIIGIVLNGKGIRITDLEFNVVSNAVKSCTSQLKIDVTEDNNVNWVNKKVLTENCGSVIKSECNKGLFSIQTAITEIPYCEKITLPESPAFEIKAGVKKISGSYYPGLLKARIHDGSTFVGECDLSEPTTDGSKCSINYANKQENVYYLCISFKENHQREGETYNYKLSAEQTEKSCGFQDDPANSPALVANYDITTFAKKYDNVGNFKINQSNFNEQNNENLLDYLNGYIQENFQGDCSTQCIIPIKFSGASQQISITNLKITYDSSGLNGITKNNFFELKKTSSKITSNYSLFNLDYSNFKVPKAPGNYSTELILGGKTLFKNEISVLKIERALISQIYPKVISAANPTPMIVFTEPSLNMSEIYFKWDFGDGIIEQTENNRVEHTYSEIQNYTLKVSIYKNSGEISSKTFKIEVVSPKQAINSTISSYKEQIENLDSQINKYSENEKEIILNYINIEDLKTEISGLEEEYKQLISDEQTIESDYVYIMSGVLLIDIPIAIQPSKTTNMKLFNNLNEIDPELISDLFDETYYPERESEYQNLITSWFLENIDATIKNEVISIYYDDHIEDILSEFNIGIETKKVAGYKGYLIIEEDEENLIFDGDYEISSDNMNTGIEIDLSRKSEIKFITEGDTDLFGLTMYLSPEFSQLKISQSQGTEKGFGWWKLVLGFIILFITAIVSYIYLQKWYSENYENKLFKNKMDLNNLLLFIKNSKIKRIDDKEIKKQLKNAGWKNEQITYGLKKFYGKSFGIPKLFTFRKKKEIKKKIVY